MLPSADPSLAALTKLACSLNSVCLPSQRLSSPLPPESILPQVDGDEEPAVLLLLNLGEWLRTALTESARAASLKGHVPVGPLTPCCGDRAGRVEPPSPSGIRSWWPPSTSSIVPCRTPSWVRTTSSTATVHSHMPTRSCDSFRALLRRHPPARGDGGAGREAFSPQCTLQVQRHPGLTPLHDRPAQQLRSGVLVAVTQEGRKWRDGLARTSATWRIGLSKHLQADDTRMTSTQATMASASTSRT